MSVAADQIREKLSKAELLLKSAYKQSHNGDARKEIRRAIEHIVIASKEVQESAIFEVGE